MINQLHLHFVTEELLKLPLIRAEYDAWMVIASVLTAVFASYISFMLSARVNGSQLKEEKRLWTLLSACFLGAGIWAMHFIGMLAYRLPIPVSYNILITILSVIPSILASFIVISPDLGGFKSIWFRSLLMGAGIGTMHYVGMMAMIMPAQMAYQPILFGTSVIVAVILSGVALKINDIRLATNNNSIRFNLLAALVMGSAISGMHYIGMMSMMVFEISTTNYLTDEQHNHLAPTILVMLLLLSLLLIGSIELRARTLLSARLKTVLHTVQDSVISINHEGIIEFANPATFEMFGYEKDTLIGQNIKMLMPAKYAEHHDQYVANSILTGTTKVTGKSRVLKGLKKTGEVFPIALTVSPVASDQGSAFVGTIRDLTDIKNQDAFMQTAFDALPIMLFVKEASDLSFSHINKAGEALLGKSREELIGLNDYDLFAKEEAEVFVEADREVLLSDDTVLLDEQPMTINGQTRYLRTRKVAVKDNNGEPKYLLGLSEDITELRDAKIELEKLSHRLAMAANAARIGVWEWNLETNELIWDDWMFKLYGVPKGKFTGDYSSWASTVHPDDYSEVVDKLEEAVSNNDEFHAEFRVVLNSGNIRHIHGDGRIYGNKMIGINFDISKRVKAENKILQLAETDQLTGLSNRNALIKFVEQEFARADRHGSKVVCLYFDLDKFKPINDTFGHQVGDHVLVVTSNRLRKLARKTDCVARIGGDEFVVMLTDIQNNGQFAIAKSRMVEAVLTPIDTDAGEVIVGTSVGVAVYPDDAANLDELLNEADARMYEDKKSSSKSKTPDT